MRKIPTSLILISVLVLILGGLGLSMLMGWIQFEDIIHNFVAFVFIIIIIAFLAVIGAIFIGMFISHRIFSSQDFTTFEEEMLRMRRDVSEIKEKIEELEEKED